MSVLGALSDHPLLASAIEPGCGLGRMTLDAPGRAASLLRTVPPYTLHLSLLGYTPLLLVVDSAMAGVEPQIAGLGWGLGCAASAPWSHSASGNAPSATAAGYAVIDGSVALVAPAVLAGSLRACSTLLAGRRIAVTTAD